MYIYKDIDLDMYKAVFLKVYFTNMLVINCY